MRRSDVLDPAPPRHGTDGEGRGGWSWLVTAKDRFEAEVLRGMLENAGVPVILDGFDRSPFAWMYPAGNMNVPVQVLVPTGLLDVARLELMEAGLVGVDRLAPASAQAAAAAGPPASLLRDRTRPLWLVVAVLTALAVALFIIVEVAGFAPCATKVFCIK
ncbi:MAG TPA: hypothetical protein VM841_00585 [Actinomycetota bacterium]|nr:hypothetical protein [Actinomycetota bacterium]